MPSYTQWLDNLPFIINPAGVRLALRFYIHPDGHGNVSYSGPDGNQPVNNIEEAVGLLREVWDRAAKAHQAKKPLPPRDAPMAPEQAVAFRDQLRAARAVALRDAEGFQEILFAIERIGCALLGRAESLGNYEGQLTWLARKSELAILLPTCFPALHHSFAVLYNLVREARNDALHQGARVRYLTRHAVSLALVLEDALMTQTNGSVADFMVRDPIRAELWQPISFIRQAMLENSFSYLPVHVAEGDDRGWFLVSDITVARYLRSITKSEERRARLGRTLIAAWDNGEIDLLPAATLSRHEPPGEALRRGGGHPVLIVDEQNPDRLLGILTPFDLL